MRTQESAVSASIDSPQDILTEEAIHIARQQEDITGVTTSYHGGFNLDDLGGYIEGNLSSMIQGIIGVPNKESELVIAEKLSDFITLDSLLATLTEASQPRL